MNISKQSKVDNFALSTREKLWTPYQRREVVLTSDNEIRSAGSGAVTNKLNFTIRQMGLLSKLLLRFKITSNDIDGNASDTFSWAGLNLLDHATLYCGDTPIHRIEPQNILAMLQQVGSSDSLIYQAASYVKKSYKATTGEQHTIFCPLMMSCFDSIDKLIDPLFTQPLRLEVNLKAVTDTLTNDSDNFTLNSVELICQHMQLDDYFAFSNNRYENMPYKITTTNMMNEPIHSFSGTAATPHTTTRMKIHFSGQAAQTYIFVSPSDTQGNHMNGVEITNLKLYAGDKIIHESTSNIEDLVLHHTEFRNETHLRDNVDPNSSLVYMINHGVHSNDQLSNYLDLKDMNLSIELTCTPSITATYNVQIAHEYYQTISYDLDGKVANVES